MQFIRSSIVGLAIVLALAPAHEAAAFRRIFPVNNQPGAGGMVNLPYQQPDGSPYRIDADYFGKKRNAAGPFPGPFELPDGGKQVLKVWPVPGPSAGR